MASVKKVWDTPGSETAVTSSPSAAADAASQAAMTSMIASMTSVTFTDQAKVQPSKFQPSATTQQRSSNMSAQMNNQMTAQIGMYTANEPTSNMMAQMQAVKNHTVYPPRVGSVGTAHQQLSSSPPVVMNKPINSPPLDNLRQTMGSFMSAPGHAGHTAHTISARPIYGSQHAVTQAATPSMGANLYQHFGHPGMDPQLHALAQVFATQATNHAAYSQHVNPATHQAVPNQASMYGMAGQQVPTPQPGMSGDAYRQLGEFAFIHS